MVPNLLHTKSRYQFFRVFSSSHKNLTIKQLFVSQNILFLVFWFIFFLPFIFFLSFLFVCFFFEQKIVLSCFYMLPVPAAAHIPVVGKHFLKACLCLWNLSTNIQLSFGDADQQIESLTIQIRIPTNSDDDYNLNPIPTTILSWQSWFWSIFD